MVYNVNVPVFCKVKVVVLLSFFLQHIYDGILFISFSTQYIKMSAHFSSYCSIMHRVCFCYL